MSSLEVGGFSLELDHLRHWPKSSTGPHVIAAMRLAAKVHAAIYGDAADRLLAFCRG